VKLFIKLLKILWYVTAGAIIVSALIVSVTRLLTPSMNERRADFEKYASNLIQRPVTIGRIQLGWHRFAPEVLINSVMILDEQTRKPELALEQLEIDLSLWHSLWAWQLVPYNITVRGVNLAIHQRDLAQFSIDKLNTLTLHDTSTGSTLQADTVIAWLFSQPRIGLKDIDIRYFEPGKKEKSLTLKALALKNTLTSHDLQGEITLHQEVPTKAAIKIKWEGDLANIRQSKASLYLYVQGLSLAQWFSDYEKSGFKITKGLMSSKIWVDVDKGEIQNFQSKFQAYQLELYSIANQSTEEITRINANIGWKREGNTQTLAGDQIYIDFPDHIWPTTSFSLVYQAGADSAYTVNSITLGYTNIVDARRIALLSSLPTDEWRTFLKEFDAEGVIQYLQANLSSTPFDMSHTSFVGKMANVSAKAWQHLPAFNNLTGSIVWNGQNGKAIVNSKKASLTFDNIFLHPLQFDDLMTEIIFQKNIATDWLFHINALHLLNKDIEANVIGDLTLTQNDSPLIDLSANFQLKKAVNVANYLPLKIFDENISKWVESAFLSGSGEQGRAVVQGRFKDFPFDKNSGKFIISTKLHDIDLAYAPGWPILKNLQGDLTFDSDTMKTVISSGAMLGVPISHVTAEILNIGKDLPSMLTVNTNIQSDLAQALNFIQESPLRETLGKDLAGVKLVGPMKLQLSLIMPLKNPEKTAVKGDVTMTAALLNVPEWKLAISQLNGGFVFTENSLEAKNIQGKLFSQLILLNITTAPNTNQIQADLSSQISIPKLESWLGASFQAFVSGETNYQAKLLLSRHTDSSENKLIIESDLKGIDVNLPENYGKKADSSKDFKVEIFLSPKPILKTKITYANLISAALSYKKAKTGLQLSGGEIKLGGQDARWQTKPGILISGSMPVLDVTTWQNYFAEVKNKSKKTLADYKLFRGLDLNARLVNVYGQQLHDASIEAAMFDSSWQIKLDSDEVGGQINLPFNLAVRAVTGQLNHLYLSSAKKPSKSRLDPRTLPALSFDINDVRYEKRKIGHVKLNVVPFNRGLLIKQLVLDDPLIKLSAGGEWTLSGNKYQTHLQGNVSTPRISEILKRWGFSPPNFAGSTGQARFDLSWRDAPYSPSLAGLSGKISMELGRGSIIQLSEANNAKISLGRLLNVFSLSSIPQRLSLDFSNSSEQGFIFDFIRGDFNLRDSNAMTDNLNFDGPIAQVSIAGRIGLAANDLNMKLSITPHMSSGLPLIAFAGGPIVGAASLIVSKVVSNVVSRAFTYQYSVTGHWDNPVWTQLNTNQVQRRAQ